MRTLLLTSLIVMFGLVTSAESQAEAKPSVLNLKKRMAVGFEVRGRASDFVAELGKAVEKIRPHLKNEINMFTQVRTLNIAENQVVFFIGNLVMSIPSSIPSGFSLLDIEAGTYLQLVFDDEKELAGAEQVIEKWATGHKKKVVSPVIYKDIIVGGLKKPITLVRIEDR